MVMQTALRIRRSRLNPPTDVPWARIVVPGEKGLVNFIPTLWRTLVVLKHNVNYCTREPDDVHNYMDYVSFPQLSL